MAPLKRRPTYESVLETVQDSRYLSSWISRQRS